MEFDLNQEFEDEIWIPDVVAVDQAVDNRSIHE